MDKLTHIDEHGNAVMVDVTEKKETERFARAGGSIRMNEASFTAITEGTVPKGDVFAAARIAGIMAAKKTPELIPLCHPLPLTKVSVDFKTVPSECRVDCECTVKLCAKFLQPAVKFLAVKVTLDICIQTWQSFMNALVV